VKTIEGRGYGPQGGDERVGDYASFEKGEVFGAIADDPDVQLYLRWTYVEDVVYEETRCLCSLELPANKETQLDPTVNGAALRAAGLHKLAVGKSKSRKRAVHAATEGPKSVRV
jgi:hypothetical protein